MTPSSTLDPKLRNRITRYLHTGNELPKYYPGCWSSHSLDVDKLKAIEEILANGSNNVEVVNIIVTAYKSGWYTRFATIALALSKCIRLGSSVIKEAAYNAASEICSTAEEMMLFHRFTRQLRTGNGSGWRRHVKQWYTTKDPMDLAKEMTRVKARHGRSHKILLRKSHVKIEETDHKRNAVIQYALFGLKRAKQLLGKIEAVKPIFEYIQKVEDLRHCEDPIAAGVMIIENKFTLDHVPGHLLTSQEVWNAVLPQLSISELLLNIQRLHNMGFLNSESETVEIIVSILTNQSLIKSSKITPIAVFITLCNYKQKTRPLKYAKAKVALERQTRRRTRQIHDPKTGQWEWTVTRRHPKEIKYWGVEQPPNPAILAALNKLIDNSWLLTPPTNARYLITLDMRHHMFKGLHFCKNYVIPKKGKKIKTKTMPGGGGDADTEQKESKKHLLAECFYNKHVTPGHAAIILAMQLLKREKNVKLAVFTEGGIQLVAIERNFSNIDEAEFVLRNTKQGRVQMDAPIEWATRTGQKFDVFINMVDRTTRYMELNITDRGGRGPGGRYGPPPEPGTGIEDHCPVRALERYRQRGVRDAKLIVMSLASIRTETTDGNHEGILDIVGIDEHVPKVIDAFVLGQFK